MTLVMPRMTRLPIDQRGITLGGFPRPDPGRRAAWSPGPEHRPDRRGRPAHLHHRAHRLSRAGVAGAHHGADVRRSARRRGARLPTRAFERRALPRDRRSCGLPWFAEGKGGVNVILGATGGYLIGFVIAGRGRRTARRARLGSADPRRVRGDADRERVIYLSACRGSWSCSRGDLPTGIAKGLTPFLVGDAMKLAAGGRGLSRLRGGSSGGGPASAEGVSRAGRAGQGCVQAPVRLAQQASRLPASRRDPRPRGPSGSSVAPRSADLGGEAAQPTGLRDPIGGEAVERGVGCGDRVAGRGAGRKPDLAPDDPPAQLPARPPRRRRRAVGQAKHSVARAMSGANRS